MVDSPSVIGLVHEFLGYRLWNTHEDSSQESAIQYVRADLYDALEAKLSEALKALIECEEYFDNIADADHDGTGFIANEEMNLQMMIRRVREGGQADD